MLNTTIIIAEKPQAARRISQALATEGELGEIKKGWPSYFEFEQGGRRIRVVYALGHLYELKQAEKGWTYPRLETEWVPRYEVEKKDKRSKPLIELIQEAAIDADKFLIATDLDIEGSLIGYHVLKYACEGDPQKTQRMRFSTLTEKELRNAYENPSRDLDFSMIDAGIARHEIDWLYGINLTRALTLAIKEVAGWFKIVSTGRVQGPTLSFAADRDRKVNLFVPEPFWVILPRGKFNGEEFDLEYSEEQIGREDLVNKIQDDLMGGEGTVEEFKQRTFERKPPVPFNLSGLQSESYRHFGFKPSRTLAIAQGLYLRALVSYPRTSSQKIPESIDVKEILEDLKEQKKYDLLAQEILKSKNLKPREGKKKDPAHPAIHPTGKRPEKALSTSEVKIYDLIIRRFFSLFGKSAVRESVRADIHCNKHVLYARGLRTLDAGWMAYYGEYASQDEKTIPDFEAGSTVDIISVDVDERYTSPPARYNPSSMVKKLEKVGLGTKATRASIVDSLKSRGYTIGDRFELSKLGYAIYETLNEHVPEILSVEMTRELEDKMNAIQEGRTKLDEVLEETKNTLSKLLKAFKEREQDIGAELVRGLKRHWKRKRELGPCPNCDDGTLVIVRSRKSGKRFVGCSNYRKTGCDQTFPLPQKGEITPLDEVCPHCGHTMIRVHSGRHPWKTCVNWADCPGRQEDLKDLKDRKSEKEKEENE
ncbi:MAG: DNA topoisomerase I [Candidatus Thorarchaeota archaeon]